MTAISKISQKSRILLLGVVLPMLIVAVLGCLYYHDCRDRAIQASVHEARALCLTAESSQQHFEQQWADEIYSRDQLSKWAAADDSHKILSTVPIIAAMNSLSANQKSAGYELKIPALEPRNPENLANEFQAAALHELQTSGLSELVKMDPATNTAHYFRPIKLDQSCLMCHGDSANAEELWGRTDGTDVTGYAMEGWRAGDLRGAFEIVQSLDAADEASAAAMRVVGGGMIAVLFICGGLSLVVLRSIKADELEHTASIGSDVAQEVSDNTAHIAAAVEELHSNVRDIAKNAAHASSTAKAVVMRVQSTNERSEALDKSSREIENIVQMIETIAEQTNLLALNATIEAARAGDAGKGFAVVAGEVKSLAQQTSAATSTITSRVASIQGTSTELLSELREMQDIINTIDATQEEIALAVSQQQSATEEISRSVHSVLDSSRSLKTRLHGRSTA